jgi:arylsulfatase A-like enzyme
MRANAYAGHFALATLCAPIVFTTLGLCFMAFPLGIFAGLRRSPLETWPARATTQLIGAMSLLGSALWCSSSWTLDREAGWSRILLASMIVPGVAFALAVVIASRAFLARVETASLSRWLKMGAAVGAVLNVLCVIPLVWVSRTQGREYWYDAQIGSTRQPGNLNVLLITIDTLRADRVNGFGDHTGATPRLDRLASESVSFVNAISQSPWTLPSIASMLTGRTVGEHGAGGSMNSFNLLARAPLAPDAWTVAEGLRTCGYATQAIVTNPFLAMHYGIGKGFGGYRNVSIDSEAFLALNRTAAVRLLRGIWPRLVAGDIGETVTAYSQSWLERHRAEKFFLWVHYLDPHAPYGDPRTLGNKSFRTDLLFDAITSNSDDIGPRFDAVARLRGGEIHLDARQRQQLVRLYDAGVRYDDEQVGRLLETLERLGLAGNTIVIIASDHGEEFWEHGGVEHGHTLYDELIRVPLILRWPEVPRGRVVPNVVRLMDIAPTIVDLTACGQAPNQIEARSLKPLALSLPDDERLALSEGLLLADEKKALRTARFKYIRSANGKEEVYDLLADPGELHDLAARQDLVAPLRVRMEHYDKSGLPNQQLP